MRKAMSGVAVLGVLVAVTIALWPLHANGVRGNALRPHFEAFGFATYAPVAATGHVTIDSLRAAGVRVPRDVVAQRRHEAEVPAATGVAALAAVVFLVRRDRRALSAT